MSGDSAAPRSETNTNGDVLPVFSFRSADTSSRSRVCTLSFEPLSRRTCKVFGPDLGIRSKSVHLVCLASELPARSARRLDHCVGLMGAEVVAPNMRTFVG
jgi:hypothetical protein